MTWRQTHKMGNAWRYQLWDNLQRFTVRTDNVADKRVRFPMRWIGCQLPPRIYSQLRPWLILPVRWRKLHPLFQKYQPSRAIPVCPYTCIVCYFRVTPSKYSVHVLLKYYDIMNRGGISWSGSFSHHITSWSSPHAHSKQRRLPSRFFHKFLPPSKYSLKAPRPVPIFLPFLWNYRGRKTLNIAHFLGPRPAIDFGYFYRADETFAHVVPQVNPSLNGSFNWMLI